MAIYFMFGNRGTNIIIEARSIFTRPRMQMEKFTRIMRKTRTTNRENLKEKKIVTYNLLYIIGKYTNKQPPLI